MNNYPMGAEFDENAPWREKELPSRTVNEQIPVWVTDESLIDVVFTLEIIDTINEDVIINVKSHNYTHFMEEWRGDITDFLYDNYSYIEEINFQTK